MASLETMNFQQFEFLLDEQGEVVCKARKEKPVIRLPQIYWRDGSGWDEANLWAAERGQTVEAETNKRSMKDVRRYASFLESIDTDWRDLPATKSKQPLRKFRKHLIELRKKGLLASSTTTNGMSTVVQFYRFAIVGNLVGTGQPFWVDRTVHIPLADSVGFKRFLVRQSSDLSIPNRQRGGVIMEGGLLPLRTAHMQDLLAYSSRCESDELYLMLSGGFFSGARLGTVTTLTVTGLERAREDSDIEGIYRLPVGPSTGIATKFSVEGEILVPRVVLDELKAYVTSTVRLLREAKARRQHKNVLFLTRSGNPYSIGTVNGLVAAMRRRAVKAGLPFMQTFKFHQTRATFGTWLMRIALECMSTSQAIRFVADAMLHKDDAMTLRYIKFLENSAAKEKMASEFNDAFTGIRNRDWNESDA